MDKTKTAAAEFDAGPLGNSIGHMLRMSQLKVFERFYEELGEFGLKAGEYSVLVLIQLNPGVRQGVVAKRLMIKRAHMTKLVRAFEERGFVKRHVPDEDRRAVELTLTEAGEEFANIIHPALRDFEEKPIGSLSKSEEAQLLALLKKFLGRME